MVVATAPYQNRSNPWVTAIWLATNGRQVAWPQKMDSHKLCVRIKALGILQPLKIDNKTKKY